MEEAYVNTRVVSTVRHDDDIERHRACFWCNELDGSLSYFCNESVKSLSDTAHGIYYFTTMRGVEKANSWGVDTMHIAASIDRFYKTWRLRLQKPAALNSTEKKLPPRHHLEKLSSVFLLRKTDVIYTILLEEPPLQHPLLPPLSGAGLWGNGMPPQKLKDLQNECWENQSWLMLMLLARHYNQFSKNVDLIRKYQGAFAAFQMLKAHNISFSSKKTNYYIIIKDPRSRSKQVIRGICILPHKLYGNCGIEVLIFEHENITVTNAMYMQNTTDCKGDFSYSRNYFINSGENQAFFPRYERLTPATKNKISGTTLYAQVSVTHMQTLEDSYAHITTFLPTEIGKLIVSYDNGLLGNYASSMPAKQYLSSRHFSTHQVPFIISSSTPSASPTSSSSTSTPSFISSSTHQTTTFAPLDTESAPNPSSSNAIIASQAFQYDKDREYHEYDVASSLLFKNTRKLCMFFHLLINYATISKQLPSEIKQHLLPMLESVADKNTQQKTRLTSREWRLLANLFKKANTSYYPHFFRFQTLASHHFTIKAALALDIVTIVDILRTHWQKNYFRKFEWWLFRSIRGLLDENDQLGCQELKKGLLEQVFTKTTAAATSRGKIDTILKTLLNDVPKARKPKLENKVLHLMSMADKSHVDFLKSHREEGIIFILQTTKPTSWIENIENLMKEQPSRHTHASTHRSRYPHISSKTPTDKNTHTSQEESPRPFKRARKT